MLLGLSFLWGFSFFFNELMLEEYPPLWVAFFRLFFGGSVVFCIGLWLSRGRGLYFSMWLKLVGQGLLGVGIPFWMILQAQESLTSGHAAVLNATAPLFGMVLSSFLGAGEVLSARKVVGVMLGILGVGVMFGDSLLSEGWGVEVEGQLGVLMASFCYGLGSVYTRKVGLLKVPVALLVGVSLLGGSFVLMIFAFVFEGIPSLVILRDGEVLASGLILGVMCTGCAYLLFYPILKRAGSKVFLCTLLVPWIALVLGNVVLGEHFDVWQILGMIVIMMSLLWIDGRFFWQRG
jgi:drug/metabolite transporter (DMT)-like permease